MRIGIFGPHLGSNPGWVTSQGEILCQRLRQGGHDVVDASDRPGRLTRAADTFATVLRSGRSLDVAAVEVFSGPAFAMAEMTVLALRALGVPTVAWLHGGNLPRFAGRHPGRVRRVLQGAARVVAPSPFLAHALSPLGKQIEVIPNALPLESYPASRRSPARPRLLWMRTFHPLYRPELAVEVLAELHRTQPEATLTMAGQDRGLRTAAMDRAAVLGVRERVAFPGFLDPEAKQHALAEHDVFLSTNAVDNAPVSVLEAAASGLVIVAMDAGGVASLLGDGGLVVPDGDVGAMADAVRSVLDDGAAAARCSDAGRAVAEASLPGPVIERWTHLLAEVRRGE